MIYEQLTPRQLVGISIRKLTRMTRQELREYIMELRIYISLLEERNKYLDKKIENKNKKVYKNV